MRRKSGQTWRSLVIHTSCYDKHNGLAMMNPGSIGAPLWGCMPSYGIITFDKEHDVMKLDVDYIEY